MWIRQTLLINIYLRISWSINNMTIKCLRIYNSTIINEYIISTEIDAIVLCSRREVCSNKRLSQCSITYFSESVSICHYYIKSSQQMISVVVCLSSCIYSRYIYIIQLHLSTWCGLTSIDKTQKAKHAIALPHLSSHGLTSEWYVEIIIWLYISGHLMFVWWLFSIAGN